jgi:xanthine dehydrogenase accessory factor
MSELLPILETLVADAEAGRSAAFCVVVQTEGSAPQVPGAAMLVRADGSTTGTLGGGCVEAEVRTRALQFLQQGKSALVQLELDHDYGWDDGLLCGGQMTIAVMPLTPTTDLAAYRSALNAARRREAASVPVVVEHEGQRVGYQLHVEVPPTLLIAGAGHIGQAVARFAVELDFRVIVIDDRAVYAAAERFAAGVECVVGDIAGTLRSYPIDASCYVVIVTRGHRHDEQALSAVVDRPAGYVGMIGSRRKSALILRDLANAGVPAEQISRIHTPIGVPIRALTVPEIAVSIMAELIRVRRQSVPKLVTGPFAVTTA